jgi:hypothetical protein
MSQKTDGEEILKLVRSVIDYSTGNSFLSFFYRSRAHFITTLLIFSKKDVDLHSLESLVSSIPGFISSRTNLRNILKEGYSAGFFQKQVNENDKRKTDYAIGACYLSQLNDWVSNHQIMFSNMK